MHHLLTAAALAAGLITANTNGQWLEEDCEALVEVTGTQSGNLFGDLGIGRSCSGSADPNRHGATISPTHSPVNPT